MVIIEAARANQGNSKYESDRKGKHNKTLITVSTFHVEDISLSPSVNISRRRDREGWLLGKLNVFKNNESWPPTHASCTIKSREDRGITI